MKRLVGLVLLLAAVALAVALVYGVRERRALAARALLDVAAGMGVEPVRLDVVDVGWKGATLLDVQVGDPADLRVERVELTWEPRALLRLEVARMALSGVRLRAALGDDGELTLGALDPAFAEDDEESGGVSYREVTVADATIELETPAGPIALEGVTARIAPDPRRIATGEGTVAAVRDDASPRRFPPLRLAARATAEGDRGLAVALEAEAAEGRVRATATGSFVPGTSSGELQLDLAPLELGPEATPLRELAPAFAKSLPEARGRLAAHARIHIGGTAAPLSLVGEIEVHELDLSRSETRLQGLDGRIRFAGPGPWRTAGTQELRFASLDLVGAFRDGRVRFAARDTEIQLDAFEATWAGGRLLTSGRLDPMNSTGGLAVQLENVDLERLLEELAIADLAGSGRLSGAMPVVLDGDSLRMSAAFASAPEGGVIRWRPAAGAAARLGLTGDLALVVDALEDYHYDEMLVGLEGDLAGEVRMRLNLKGSNPAYENGRPVHLNLQVETNVPATLLASRAVTRIPDALERRLRRRAGTR